MLGIVSPDAVFYQDGISETQFVVFVEQCLLGFLVTFRRELLGSHETTDCSCFIELLQRTFSEKGILDFAGLQLLVAFDVDMAHFGFLFLVDDNIEYHLVFLGDVLALHDVDLGVVESFVIKVSTSQDLGAVNHVLRNLSAFEDTKLLFQVFTLALLDTNVVDG